MNKRKNNGDILGQPVDFIPESGYTVIEKIKESLGDGFKYTTSVSDDPNIGNLLIEGSYRGFTVKMNIGISNVVINGLNNTSYCKVCFNNNLLDENYIDTIKEYMNTIQNNAEDYIKAINKILDKMSENFNFEKFRLFDHTFIKNISNNNIICIDTSYTYNFKYAEVKIFGIDKSIANIDIDGVNENDNNDYVVNLLKFFLK